MRWPWTTCSGILSRSENSPHLFEEQLTFSDCLFALNQRLSPRPQKRRQAPRLPACWNGVGLQLHAGPRGEATSLVQTRVSALLTRSPQKRFRFFLFPCSKIFTVISCLFNIKMFLISCESQDKCTISEAVLKDAEFSKKLNA